MIQKNKIILDGGESNTGKKSQIEERSVQNKVLCKKIITFLKKNPLNDSDVDTIAISLNPNYEYYSQMGELTTFHSKIKETLKELIEMGIIEEIEKEILTHLREGEPAYLKYKLYKLKEGGNL